METLENLEKPKILIILLLILFTRLIWLKIEKISKESRLFQGLSESLICLLIGFGTAWLVDNGNLLKLNTHVFYLLLLPPVIFEGGYTLQYVPFLSRLGTILSLAFLGGIFSCLVSAILLFTLGNLFGKGLELKECLIWGSLISSTDPVTVLTLLGEVPGQELLFILIFGESALNDAVAVIFYRYFTEVPVIDSLTLGLLAHSILNAIVIFLVSVMVGLVTAIVTCLLLRWCKQDVPSHNPSILHLVILLCCAYASYLLGEIVQATGIISVFACGMGMGWWVGDGQQSAIKPCLISTFTGLSFKSFLRVFNTLSESIIFLYLGMGLEAWRETEYDFTLILIGIFSVIISRCHVFLILSFPRLVNGVKLLRQKFGNHQVQLEQVVPFKYQLVVFLAGLRGAVAFALCIEILSFPLKNSHTLFGTGVVVIAWTIVFIGSLLPWLISNLTRDVEFYEEQTTGDWSKWDFITQWFSKVPLRDVRDVPIQTPVARVPKTLSIQLRDPTLPPLPSPREDSLDRLVVTKSTSLRTSMTSLSRLNRVL